MLKLQRSQLNYQKEPAFKKIVGSYGRERKPYESLGHV